MNMLDDQNTSISIGGWPLLNIRCADDNDLTMEYNDLTMEHN